MRGLPRKLGLAGGLFLSLYLLGSIDWRAAPPTSPPQLETLASEGALRVGLAVVPFTPKAPMPLGGFSRRKGDLSGVLDPVYARALLLNAGRLDLAIVSLDLLLVPPALAEAISSVAREAGIERVIVTATHTHAAPGGYFDNLLARFGGLGAYDEAFTRSIVEATGQALRAAQRKLTAARLTVHDGRGPALCRSRIPGRAPDRRLSVLTLATPDGATTLGRVVVFACHPTVLGHRDHRLSAGWPGALARKLEGVTLLLQGAVGDVTHGKLRPETHETHETHETPGPPGPGFTPEEKMRALGARVAAVVRALEASGPGQRVESFRETRARVALPAPSAAGFAPEAVATIASNLLTFFVPKTAQLSVLELGSPGAFRLAFLPGEVVSPLGARWAREMGDRSLVKTRVVSLADGYLGYLETPEALEARVGESRRAYFDAATITRLEEALEAITVVPPG